MPFFKLKKVWEYCSYNIPFFVFILLLIFVLNMVPDFSNRIVDFDLSFMAQIIGGIILTGYGMSITRDRINHGYRLPKIMPKDVFEFGIKAGIAYAVYAGFQAALLTFISTNLDFPIFDLKEMLLDYSGTLNMFFSHNLVHTIIFLVVSAVVFYVTTFFADVGLAKLADTKRFFSAFDLKAIFKSIGVFGWRNYTRDITSIIVAIVILSYVKSISFPYFWIDNLWEMFFGFLIFVTQYLGIGAVYCKIKDTESGFNGQ